MGERVALIQNRVQRGGRFQVSSEMVRVLNEREIVPDFICFRNRIDLPEIKRVYGSDLKLRFINIPEPRLLLNGTSSTSTDRSVRGFPPMIWSSTPTTLPLGSAALYR